MSSALTTLANTFKDTPPDLKIALQGVAQFSDTLNTRDAKLRQLLADANKVTGVLAKRSDQIAQPGRQRQRAAGRACSPNAIRSTR